MASAIAWGGTTAVVPADALVSACSPTSSTVGSATVLSFTTVGTCAWTVPAGVAAVDVLIVAGGGGGGGFWGGGGGGGGVLYGTSIATSPGAALSVTVGAGGAGSTSTGSYSVEDLASRGSSGGDSSFADAVAKGGGGGGGFGSVFGNVGIGLAGGSSGGNGELKYGGTGTAASTPVVPSGYVAYGNAGGSVGAQTVAGSGGGGASAAGGSPASYNGGDGGAGQSFDITGTPTYYAGGGGGGSFATPGAGGTGGGGSGGNGGSAGATAGTNGTGGGGGAAGYTASFNPFELGAAGGSGIVIVRFTPQSCSLTGVTTIGQGGWPSRSSTNQLNTLWSAQIAPGNLRIGGDNRSITLRSTTAVRSFLPQSGTPSVLASGNALDPSSKLVKNTLAGQAVALTLNLAMNSGMKNAYLVGVVHNGTVADLLDLVNAALNGTGNPSKTELSRLSTLADYVNTSFLGGVNAGRLTCTQPSA